MRDVIALGVDLGTSSCKVSVVDSSGRRLGSATASYPISTPQDGWSEQDPADWVAAVPKAVNAVIARTGRQPATVSAVALTSAAHIAVLVGANGRPLRPALLWNDQRSEPEARQLSSSHGSMIFEQTCNQIAPAWTLAHLAWIKANDDRAWAALRHVYFSKDYIINWMTGAACTDIGTAVSSMLYDVQRERWSPELCSLLGLDDSMLPSLRPVDAVVGTLQSEAAAALGLPVGIPVVNGTIDSAVETWCAGAVKEGDCVIRLGSAGGIHLVWDSLRRIPRATNYPHPTKPHWYSQAGTNAAGTSLNWIRSTVGEAKPIDHEQFARLVQSAPAGSDGLLFHPYLAGERCPYWNSELRGGFTGLSFRHGQAHLIRAVLEGVCYSLRDAFSTFDAVAPPVETLSVVGGGVGSREWLEILAAVLARPLVALPLADSAYGAALIGLSAVNATVSSGDRPGQDLAEQISIEPTPESIPVYERGFQNYRHAARRLLDYHAHTP